RRASPSGPGGAFQRAGRSPWRGRPAPRRRPAAAAGRRAGSPRPPGTARARERGWRSLRRAIRVPARPPPGATRPTVRERTSSPPRPRSGEVLEHRERLEVPVARADLFVARAREPPQAEVLDAEGG